MTDVRLQSNEPPLICGWCAAPVGGVHGAGCLYPGEKVRRWQCVYAGAS